MDEFIILRDLNGAAWARQLGPSPFSEAAAGDADMLEHGVVEPPEPEVRVERLGGAELRELRRDPTVIEVARAMPVRLIAPRADDADGDGDGPATWGVSTVRADRCPFDGAGVKVAVLDTGIDAAHPAFAGVELIRRDFTGEGLEDGNGHGTHCAGTIFGREVGGRRIGVAPGIDHALIGKVLDSRGGGSSKMLFDAMFWAASEGAKVISMSLGFDFPGLGRNLIQQGFPEDLATSVALEAYRKNIRVFDALLDLFRAQAAMTGGTVVVAASGNESRRDRDPDHEVGASLPAAAFGVLSVGALERTDAGLTVPAFSNTGAVLSAPGVGVRSAKVGGGLKDLSGTSMACPHVAGVAALWWQALAEREMPPNGGMVSAHVRAAARQDVFVEGTDAADRGEGLVQAPG